MRRVTPGPAHGSEADDLVLAVSEACGNVVRHTASRAIEVNACASPSAVEVEILDQGVFRRRASARRSRELSADGFGISLMRSLVDECRIEEGSESRPGTRVVLVKYLSGQDVQTSRR